MWTCREPFATHDAVTPASNGSSTAPAERFEARQLEPGSFME